MVVMHFTYYNLLLVSTQQTLQYVVRVPLKLTAMSKKYFTRHLPIRGGEENLFLCTRDIQPGMRVVCLLSTHYGKEFDVQMELGQLKIEVEPGRWEWNPKQEPYPFVFKIGKVSSEAKWVKEGDEFDEVEIELVMSSGYRFVKTGQCMGGEVEGYSESVPKHIVHIKIKGPCGHFH